MSEPHLSVRGLDKWYGSIHALKAFDLDVERGEVLGLIGDNGAGKSTFIKIVSGVERKSAGQIYFEGREVEIAHPREAMNFGIETIYQHTAMIPDMSISRNVFIGRERRKWGRRGFGLLDETSMAKDAMAALENVGLHLGSAETPVKDLSGGQRQGVAIARAMYFRSRMLILDEPTNHLSVKETRRVLSFVRQLQAQGITVIFISHNLHHVKEVASRIVVLARGSKIADVASDDASVDQLVDLIT